MLPKKDGKPIAFKCTAEFRKETEAIADSLGMSLSDYCREAVRRRNLMEVTDSRACINSIGGPLSREGEKAAKEKLKTMEKDGKAVKAKSKLDKVLSQKPKYPKNDMVNPLFKGGK